jgi:hypothetical protein
MTEESQWQSRKQKVREKYWEAISRDPSTTSDESGGAATPVAPEAVRSAMGASSARLASSATPATGTASTTTPPSLPFFGTPAGTTRPSSYNGTIWGVTPVGFLEANWNSSTVGPNGSLVPGLPTNVQSSLRALATGRGEPVEAVIQAIAEFYVEAEDALAEGTLGEMLESYVTNQLL